MDTPNPAIAAFIESLAPARTFAQITVSRRTESFELRHCQDAETPAGQLKLLPPKELRDWVAKDGSGRFRPLHSAPDLCPGWRCLAASASALWDILNILYPGGIGDWHAARQRQQTIVNYRDFAVRQSGMFRIAARLSDSQAQRAANACCADRHCLKQRLWSTTENPSSQTRDLKEPALVCLEPCPLLLELARRSFKLDRSQSVSLELPEEEIGVLLQALDCLSQENRASLRTADFSAPANPRRLGLLRERITAQLPQQKQEV